MQTPRSRPTLFTLCLLLALLQPCAQAASLVYSDTVFTEAASNNGALGNALTLKLSGDSFNAPVGTNLLSTGRASIAHLPTGLSASLLVNSATEATLSLGGSASSHEDRHDVYNLSITLADSAVQSGNATKVSGHAQESLRIDFNDNSSPAEPFEFEGDLAAGQLDDATGFTAQPATLDMVSNIGSLSGQVGVAENGLLVLLSAPPAPLQFAQSASSRVFISFAPQALNQLQLGGQTLTVQTNPETLTKQRNTFLATYALRQPAGGTQTGLLLTQGEAMLRNTEGNSLLGGFLLGSETLLREVTVRTGSAGATAHISRLSDTAAISLESGDATLTLYPPRNVTAAATTLQLKAGEVARFNGDGQLLGVYFGSLSGKLGKAGDPIRLERPDGLTAYPLWAPRLSGSNMPARLGMSPQDYLAAQLGASVSQQADGTLKLSLPGTSLSVFPQGSLAAISTGASQFNTDGSYHFSSPLLQLDVTAVLQDMTRFAPLLLQSGLQTQITSNGLLQLQSSNPASASTFLLGRPQLGYSSVPAIVPTSIAVDGQGIVHWHNGQGASQLIYPVFHDLAFITEAAEKGGWFVSPSGEGRLTLSNAAGAEYLLRPDYQVQTTSGNMSNLFDAFWVAADGSLYVRYPGNLMQRFTLE
ncbi:hypothetical protein GCM10007907_25810 [Chitinimonas prasina]|uniref:Uncharacterized protein n=1 Tax=Chitinimonas prasina TaxID=1434937 RepID=A0ABQ5YFL4_9NEIS|nr:hypothetical protein [Chitinimonas prasina]GLR13791.1 hypothetical protein GCM10007907_25810 [Chitinimonas prasina]